MCRTDQELYFAPTLSGHTRCYLSYSTTWISEVCRRVGLGARRTGAERVRAPTETAAVLEATAARRAPPPAATRPSDSLGWPDGPRGTLAALGFPFCFSRENLSCPIALRSAALISRSLRFAAAPRGSSLFPSLPPASPDTFNDRCSPTTQRHPPSNPPTPRRAPLPSLPSLCPNSPKNQHPTNTDIQYGAARVATRV